MKTKDLVERALSQTQQQQQQQQSPAVLSQESGHVYISPRVMSLWGDYSARWLMRQEAGRDLDATMSSVINTYLYGGGASTLRYNTPRFGLGNYGTMPRERALAVYVSGGYEYFKSDGLPGESC